MVTWNNQTDQWKQPVLSYPALCCKCCELILFMSKGVSNITCWAKVALYS